MLRSFLYCSILMLALVACNSPIKTSGTSGKQYFGEKISEEGVISYSDLTSKTIGKEPLAVKVKGRVAKVCQVKGCWMTIVEADKENMHVKFKDYDFFMPLDISGKEVIMEGHAFRETTSVKELKHIAEDEKKTVEEIAAITEPKEELKFMASGVILLNDTKL